MMKRFSNVRSPSLQMFQAKPGMPVDSCCGLFLSSSTVESAITLSVAVAVVFEGDAKSGLRIFSGTGNCFCSFAEYPVARCGELHYEGARLGRLRELMRRLQGEVH
jgi:hypothetical protein